MQIRYYTVLLVAFDVAQIHSFAIPGVTTVDVYVSFFTSSYLTFIWENSCVAMDPTIRVVGALSLWVVEIMMQTRVYCLFGRSKRVWKIEKWHSKYLPNPLLRW